MREEAHDVAESLEICLVSIYADVILLLYKDFLFESGVRKRELDASGFWV
jgi:hypothetical protein